METTKLTLSIPKKILAEAKLYSEKTGQPLSRLVSRYFSLLVHGQKTPDKGDLVSPRVKKVTGLAKSSRDEKEILLQAMRKKYL